MRTSANAEWGLLFEAGTDNINVPADASIANIFDGGGFVEATIRVDGMGGGDFGRIYERGITDNFLFVTELSGSTCRLDFWFRFSDNIATWKSTDRVITLGETHIIRLEYNASSTANNPTIYVNNISVGVTRQTAPSGTRTSDATTALVVGNREGLDRGFDGVISRFRCGAGASWLINEGSGSTVYDNVSGNEGTITGADWIRVK